MFESGLIKHIKVKLNLDHAWSFVLMTEINYNYNDKMTFYQKVNIHVSHGFFFF